MGNIGVMWVVRSARRVSSFFHFVASSIPVLLYQAEDFSVQVQEDLFYI